MDLRDIGEVYMTGQRRLQAHVMFFSLSSRTVLLTCFLIMAHLEKPYLSMEDDAHGLRLWAASSCLATSARTHPDLSQRNRLKSSGPQNHAPQSAKITGSRLSSTLALPMPFAAHSWKFKVGVDFRDFKVHFFCLFFLF